MRGSLQRRFTLALVAVALVAVLAVGAGVWAIAAVGARSDARVRTADQLEAFDDLTDGSIVLRARAAAVVARFARAFDVDEVGFVVIDDDGTMTVLAGLEAAPAELDRAQVEALDRGEDVFVDRPRQVVGVRLLDVGGPRQAEEARRTAVVISDEVTPLTAQVRRWFLLSAAGVLLLAVVVGGWLARRLAAPLRAIEATTEAVAAGRLDARVQVDPVAGEDDEIARLGRAVNTMAADLERSRALEQQFLLSVSHDLRTPMTAIRGYAEGLRDGAIDTPDEVRSAAAVIDRQAERLDRLIRDLLDLARLDSRQFPLERSTIDLAAVASEVVAAQRMTAAGDDVALRLTGGAAGARVVGDHDRLAQVLGNLVDNALRFADTEVEVAVHTPADGLVSVSVVDDGPGIASEDLPHVFERLYVTQRSPRRAEQSSGLGLAIVHELIAAMGGEIEVRSPRVDGSLGTAFTVSFPLALPQPG